MSFKAIAEIPRQVVSRLPVIFISSAVQTVIVFVNTMWWKKHAASLYAAQMSVIDAVLFNCQRAFLSFVLPILILNISLILSEDEHVRIAIRRKSRQNIWNISVLKTAVICFCFTLFYTAAALLSANFSGISVLINWQNVRSVYYSANFTTTERFTFSGLLVLSVLYIFLTAFFVSMLFLILKNSLGSVAGITLAVVFGINEAWFSPILTRFSGLYHIQLTDEFNPLICLGLPTVLSAAAYFIGRKICLRKEFYY